MFYIVENSNFKGFKEIEIYRRYKIDSRLFI